MKYRFKFNNAGYPLCIVEAPHDLFGQFLSFEIVPTRIKEIELAIEKFKSTDNMEVEVERDDAVLTIFPNGEVDLDMWAEDEEARDSEKITISDFEKVFFDWKNFLENKWEGYERCK